MTYAPPPGSVNSEGGITALPVIGVLALQGDVREHVRALEEAGADAKPVRRLAEIEAVDGLVIPGGESTTLWKLATAFELMDPLSKLIKEGLPAFGSCAGMIMLADRLQDGVQGQQTFGGIDMTVRRNAFGRQVDSFERDIALRGDDKASRSTRCSSAPRGSSGPGPTSTCSPRTTVGSSPSGTVRYSPPRSIRNSPRTGAFTSFLPRS